MRAHAHAKAEGDKYKCVVGLLVIVHRLHVNIRVFQHFPGRFAFFAELSFEHMSCAFDVLVCTPIAYGQIRLTLLVLHTIGTQRAT